MIEYAKWAENVRERFRLQKQGVGGRPETANSSENSHFSVVKTTRNDVENGGLMSYYADLSEHWDQVAGYVDRILKGTAPGELPVALPTKFQLVLNLKTVRALGLTIPSGVLAIVDDVIE